MKVVLVALVLALPMGAWGQAPSGVYGTAEQMAMVQQAGFPKGWHVRFVDELEWASLGGVYHPKTETAFTVLEYHVTYIRDLHASFASTERLRHTLLHELGHVRCNCTSETAAERFAKRQEAR